MKIMMEKRKYKKQKNNNILKAQTYYGLSFLYYLKHHSKLTNISK